MVKCNAKYLLCELPARHQERVALLCLVAVVVVAAVVVGDIFK